MSLPLRRAVSNLSYRGYGHARLLRIAASLVLALPPFVLNQLQVFLQFLHCYFAAMHLLILEQARMGQCAACLISYGFLLRCHS